MKINVKRCIYELFRKLFIIIISTLIFAIMGIVVALATSSENTYYGVSSVCSLVYGSYSETVNGQDALSSFASISESSRVANRAAIILGDDDIDADTIKSMVSVQASGENSRILDIYAYAKTPELAIDVANAVADAFVIELKNITGADNVQVLDKAEEAKIYIDESTQQIKIIFIYALCGFVLICAVIVFATIFSSKITSLDECTMNGDLDLIGVIPESTQI